MARIPLVTLNDIPAHDKAAFDRFVKTRGAFPDTGPYALIAHMPVVAEQLDLLRRTLRDEPSPPQPVQELVMITVAREMDCGYIWYAHAASARKIGVRGDIIDNLREKRALAGLSPEQQAAVDYTREMLRNRKVGKAAFDAATAAFGQRGTLALTNLVAVYAVLAYVMDAYELDPPQHATEPALTA